MKLRAFALVLATLGCDSTAAADSHAKPAITVHFSPKGGCTDAVVDLIGEAKHTVRLAGYSFTSAPIAVALVTAQRNGVDVQLVLDRSDAGPSAVKGSKADVVSKSGAEVWIDRKHQIMHDKFLIIDGSVVETGSFNYTQQAEHGNAENCLVIRDRDLAQLYAENWDLHQRHSSAL